MLRRHALYNKRFWYLSISALYVKATRKEPANAGSPLSDQPIEAQVYLAECIQSVIHTQY